MNPVLSRTLSTTARMSAATSLTMVLASAFHRGAPWAGINAMTRAVEPDRRTPKKFVSARTLLGLAVLTGGLGVTSAIYEAALARAPRRRGMVTGTLVALSGYAIDRWLLPKPLLRSFERNMGPVGTFAKYAAIALAASAPTR
jgi:hypothetical protein